MDAVIRLAPAVGGIARDAQRLADQLIERLRDVFVQHPLQRRIAPFGIVIGHNPRDKRIFCEHGKRRRRRGAVHRQRRVEHFVRRDSYRQRGVVVGRLKKGLILHLDAVRLGESKQHDVDHGIECAAGKFLLPVDDIISGQRARNFGDAHIEIGTELCLAERAEVGFAHRLEHRQEAITIRLEPEPVFRFMAGIRHECRVHPCIEVGEQIDHRIERGNASTAQNIGKDGPQKAELRLAGLQRQFGNIGANRCWQAGGEGIGGVGIISAIKFAAG